VKKKRKPAVLDATALASRQLSVLGGLLPIGLAPRRL